MAQPGRTPSPKPSPRFVVPRSPPVSQAERELVIKLVCRRIGIIECGVGKCRPGSKALRQRNAAWESIVQAFNSSPTRTRTQLATRKRLENVWLGVKTRMRKKREETPSNKPLADPSLAAVERAIETVMKRREQAKKDALKQTSTKKKRQKSDHSPSEPREENEDMNSASAAEFLGTPTTQVMTAAKYCPRTLYVSLTPADIVMPPRLERQTSAAVPSEVQGDQSSNHPEDQRSRRTSARAHQPVLEVPMVQPASIVRSTSTAQPMSVVLRTSSVQPTSMIQPNSMFPSDQTQTVDYPGMNPQNRALFRPTLTEAVTDNATGTSCGATQQALQPSSQTPISCTEVSTSRRQSLEAKQLQDRHFQLVSQMEKYLHETKTLTEDTLERWTEALREARMKTAPVSLEEKLAVAKLQQQREAELHAAKMRNEELNFSMQQELHSVRMHTAQIEKHQAELNKQILELKLQQALIELGNSQKSS